MSTIWTAGYANATPESLRAAAEGLDAVVVDARYRPWSKGEEWRKPALQRLLGGRYAHVPGWGNRNYKGDGPIELVDPQAAVLATQRLVEGHAGVLLLCQCWSWVTCHRRMCADVLEQATGWPILHLTPADLKAHLPRDGGGAGGISNQFVLLL